MPSSWRWRDRRSLSGSLPAAKHSALIDLPFCLFRGPPRTRRTDLGGWTSSIAPPGKSADTRSFPHPDNKCPMRLRSSHPLAALPSSRGSRFAPWSVVRCPRRAPACPYRPPGHIPIPIEILYSDLYRSPGDLPRCPPHTIPCLAPARQHKPRHAALAVQTCMEMTGMANSTSTSTNRAAWDHSSHPDFFNYYARKSLSCETLERFTRVRDKALTLLAQANGPARTLEVVDIGCGAGTQCRLWAQSGHRVHGIDVNEALIEVAARRARQEQFDIAFKVGSATELPYDDGSMDVSLLTEILEHVTDWRTCLIEAARVLKPGGPALPQYDQPSVPAAGSVFPAPVQLVSGRPETPLRAPRREHTTGDRQPRHLPGSELVHVLFARCLPGKARLSLPGSLRHDRQRTAWRSEKTADQWRTSNTTTTLCRARPHPRHRHRRPQTGLKRESPLNARPWRRRPCPCTDSSSYSC